MKYFTLNELCFSTIALKHKIDNDCSANEIVCSNLKNLVSHILDPLREIYGKPIKVNSGYRCEELNKIVGGVKNSQHQYGQAVDIVADDMQLLWSLAKQFDFDQLINENNLKWIHISFVSPTKNRHQILSR